MSDEDLRSYTEVTYDSHAKADPPITVDFVYFDAAYEKRHRCYPLSLREAQELADNLLAACKACGLERDAYQSVMAKLTPAEKKALGIK